MGGRLEVKVGDETKGAYLAKPESGQGPGVLLFHSWWGLNDFFRDLSDRIAKEGFVVLAPDYYGGRVASTIEAAKKLRSSMERKEINRFAREALYTLQDLPSVTDDKAGAIGFSLGCGFALWLARGKPDRVGAVVLFYGTGGGKYRGVDVDFQGHFAEHDEWGAHPRKVEAFRERLSEGEGQVEFHTYPNTSHWFFESDRVEAYDQEASEQAWQRTIEFLGSRLK